MIIHPAFLQARRQTISFLYLNSFAYAGNSISIDESKKTQNQKLKTGLKTGQ